MRSRLSIAGRGSARLSAFLTCIALLACSTGAAAADASLSVRSVKGRFDDVKERAVAAIENRGLVINYTAHIGAMLERTGKDLGVTRRIFEHADALEFCSARVSRETMEADPHNIGFCPYVINIYVLSAEPGRVHVSYRKLPASHAMRPAARLVEEIVKEALK